MTLEGEAGAPASPAPAVERFGFTGDAREYFGIWIVNLFLTLVTFGRWDDVLREPAVNPEMRMARALVAYAQGVATPGHTV